MGDSTAAFTDQGVSQAAPITWESGFLMVRAMQANNAITQTECFDSRHSIHVGFSNRRNRLRGAELNLNVLERGEHERW